MRIRNPVNANAVVCRFQAEHVPADADDWENPGDGGQLYQTLSRQKKQATVFVFHSQIGISTVSSLIN